MTPAQLQSNDTLQKKFQSVIWEGCGTVLQEINTDTDAIDDVQKKVNKAIEAIEITCTEVLHAQHTLFGLMNATLKT